jgi:excisionase family DNA binding protein
MSSQKLLEETVYDRLFREATSLANYLMRADMSSTQAGRHANWILTRFDLISLRRVLDTTAMGLSQRRDKNTGEFIVFACEQESTNPERNDAIMELARLLDRIEGHSPSDAPAFNQMAADLLAVTDALRWSIRPSFDQSTAAAGDEKSVVENYFVVTVTEAAEFLGVSKSTVTKWANTGKLESQGSGRDRRIHVMSMLRSRSNGSPSSPQFETDEAVYRKFASKVTQSKKTQ